ncbi:MAG: ribonuclease R [Clostridiales bacterium]|nr:ribonuclease R [Clostridiales bacterium]
MKKGNKNGKRTKARGINNIPGKSSNSKGRSDLEKQSTPLPTVGSTAPKGPVGIRNSCIGILRKSETDYYVDPDPGYSFDQYGKIRIPPDQLNGAPLNMKVVCAITNPDDPAGYYVGTITEVLGDPGQSDVAMRAIFLQYGIPETFPDVVSKQAEKLPMHPAEEDIREAIRQGRKDLRSMRTVTIDGEDAKDLDDAISIEKIPGKGYLLFVHIADVAQYVTDSSEIDLEARRRGTSVYPVDRVVPMLPPRLSNGLCSLNPSVPRFALTVKMMIDYQGEVTNGEIFESIIQSDARTTYKEVYGMLYLDETIERYLPIREMFDDMNALMIILKDKRNKRGAIEFNFPETGVKLDEAGKPTDIFASPITEANKIIEEFMIVCNEFVATEFASMKHPFIYRVHEEPDELKITEFLHVAKLFGAKTAHKGKVTPEFLAGLMSQIVEETYAPALSLILLRSLAKARYAPENLGHFGLNSKCYCHFTSPIRRYPDLYIHRIIKAYLHHDPKTAYFSANVHSVSDHSSEMERNAAEAERETTDQKITEYMVGHIGDVFEGIISGISQSGLYVRLENTAEGMVPFRSMPDYFEYDERRLEARGRSSGRVYRIGERLKIKVAAADIVLRRIDFVIEGEEEKIPKVKNFDKKREPRQRHSPKNKKGKGKKRR